MKKNRIIASGLIGLLAVTTVSGVIASADAVSKGSVEFVTDTNTSPKPFDPTDPTVPPKEVNPTDPTNPGGSGNGTQGLLRFERVPNFHFEKITIGSNQKAKVYQEQYTDKATNTAFHAAPSVEITDVRGTAEGWKASVNVDGELKGKSNTITGYELSFNKAVVSSYSNVSTPLPALKFDETTNGPLVLNTAPSPFVNAPGGSGTASWGINFYDGTDAAASVDGKPAKNTTGTATTSDAVTLTIPQGAVMKTGEVYTTTLTWTLSAAE